MNILCIMSSSRCLEYKQKNLSHLCVKLARFKGNYEGHECLIEVENVRPEDAGQWKCEMESYVWGIGRGTVKKRAIEVAVVSNGSEGATGEDHRVSE